MPEPGRDYAQRMGRAVSKRRVTRVSDGSLRTPGSDCLAGEEPLEVRIDGGPLTVRMRTPGHDYELAAGFLVSEGVVADRDEFSTATYCRGAGAAGENTWNVLNVTLGAGVEPPSADLSRSIFSGNVRGVCGKSGIEALEDRSRFEVATDRTEVKSELLLSLPERLRAGRKALDRTGGLHAAGLFDAETGEALVIREDVDLQNAVDKAIGWALMEGRLPLAGCALHVSDRVGFELVRRAKMAGIPIFSAAAAPSALAVDLAQSAGITLAGPGSGEGLVIYSHPDRIEAPA